MVRAAKERANLTGRKKAAILLAASDLETAANIYRHLSDEEIEQITLEISNLGTVSSELVEQVVEEFACAILAPPPIVHGGVSSARNILEKALGAEKSIQIIERLQGMHQSAPFNFLKIVDSNDILPFFQNEHPQILALILSFLDYKQSAGILEHLDSSLAADLASRIARIEAISPEIISELERVFAHKAAAALSIEFSPIGGIQAAAEMVNRLSRDKQKTLIESLESENPELAAEIKKLMFTFNDIQFLDDRLIQVFLREVDFRELAIALKDAKEEVQSKIFRNVSSRAADNLREDMEFMGPMKPKWIEEAQRKILSIISRIKESHEWSGDSPVAEVETLTETRN
ncbi:MAG: flagellar motor switch protein FliG [Candidatus Omnitrophota bacterium]